jgi:hypothetical protein
MSIRLAALAGVAAVAITAMIKEINADQHLPHANSAAGNSAQAAGLMSNQPCGCSPGLESSAPTHAPTPRFGADYFELELKKLRQAIIDAEAQRERADKERKLLENELHDMKRLLAAAQQLAAQKDAQIADLRAQLTGTPVVTVPTTKTPTSPQGLGRIRSGPVASGGRIAWAAPGRPSLQSRFSETHRWRGCLRAVGPLYRYGPYQMIPPWEERLR